MGLGGGSDRSRVLAGAARAFAEKADDLRALLDFVARRTSELLDVGVLLRLVRDDDATNLFAAFDADSKALALFRAMAEKPLRAGEPGLFGRAIATGEPVFVPHVSEVLLRASLKPDLYAFAADIHVKSLASAPLSARGRPVGVLMVFRHGARAAVLEEEAVPALDELAKHAGIAIANARMLDDARRALVDQRRDADRFLDAVIENLPNMVFVKDARRLAFTRVNREAEKLLGLGRAELIGKTDYDFFPEDQAAFFQAKDRETLAAADVVDITEEPIDTKSGKRWLHTKKVTIPDENGEPAYLLGISMDVTDRKHAEQALHDAQVALEATNRELEAFSWSVSHDLRAPLRSMDGFATALEEDCAERLGEEGKAHVARVRAAAKRMGVLIEDLLRLARISQASLERNDVDVSAIAHEVVTELRARDPDRVVDVTIADGITAYGDASLLRIVLENLVGNAWKFTSKQARARIEVGIDAGGVFVRDDGEGFDAAYKEKLFTAFQRLHTAAEYPGSGIGLATVQRVVRRHGGSVSAESPADRGRGATFRFTLGRRVS